MKKLLLLGAILLSFSSSAQFAVEHFDEPWTGTPPAPPQWSVINVGGTGVTWEQSPLNSAEYPAYGNSGRAALLKIDIEPATNPVQEDWLVTKLALVPAGGPINFHFMSRLLLNGDQGSIYKVLYAPSTADPTLPSSYTELQTWTELSLNPNQLEYTEKIINIPPQLAGTSVRFAFVMIGNNADGWLVDDIGISAICPSPTNLVVANVTTTTATLGWTSNYATTWEIEVIPALATPTGTGIIINSNPAVISATTNSAAPFVPGGEYKFYVRALCEDGGVSTWTGPMYFPNVSCPAPTDVAVSESTLTSITYVWTATSSANGYDYWATTTNEVPDFSTTPFGTVASNTATLTPVNAGDNYKFYVRANCGNGEYSFWSGLPEVNQAYNAIHGRVQYDSNENGVCDSGDVGLPYTEVQVQVNDISFSVYTNQNGYYHLAGWQDGTYTVNLQVVSPLFTSIDPVVQVVTFDDEVNSVDVNHCLGIATPIDDLEVAFISFGTPRPGFNNFYTVSVKNSGTTIMEDVVLTMSFDNNRISFLSSGLPGAVATGGNIVVPMGDIQPFTAINGYFQFSVMQPPVNVGSESLHFEVSLSAVPDDVTPANNQAVLNQTIVNSFDPNDITVHEGAEIYEDQADDYLTYTIRFQNTGTAEAINVRLENTLDNLLDWSTFKPIASSHVYEVKRTDSLLEFEYKDIYLPDSTSNEPGSHGFVTYKIKPKAEYGLGDIVSNTAEIYFDFNEAVVTNTVTTEVVEITAGLNDNALTIARLYPNPVKDQLHVAVSQGELQSVVVYDINGRLCLSANNSIIDTYTLKSGIYFVKVTTDAGSGSYKLIKH